jgi:predicted negative regulator of RcsB-dependent stress response
MNRSARKRWALGLAALAAAAPLQAANVVYLTNGKSIQATAIQWRPASQEYRVESGGAVVPVPKAHVERLEIDKPAEYDQAAQMIAAKQYDAAIPILDGLVTKYTMLVWDNQARLLLAQAYVGKNEPKKAISAMEEVFANMRRAEVPPDLHLLYWKALLADNRASTLKKELDEVIATGSRDMAAAAMLMRGDTNRAGGQKEDALYDYLRVVILFEAIEAIQPEALFKAAEILDELRDPRADQMRKRLVEKYGASEYARKLTGRM